MCLLIALQEKEKAKEKEKYSYTLPFYTISLDFSQVFA